MNPTTPYHPAARSRSTVIAVLMACLAAAAIILVGLSNVGPINLQSLTGAPQRYEYCTREWRQQHLPPDMQAQFADWCEQRPGR